MSTTNTLYPNCCMMTYKGYSVHCFFCLPRNKNTFALTNCYNMVNQNLNKISSSAAKPKILYFWPNNTLIPVDDY